MKHFRLPALVAAAALLAVITSQGSAVAAKKKSQNSLFATLSGYNENPTLVSPGFGDFSGMISEDGTRVDYTLTYGGMETPTAAAHIHLGREWLNGPVFVFLCGGARAPACPPEGGTVEGFFEAEDITAGAAGQGLPAGDLEKALAAIRAGATYANVHTMARPGGEIRGQVQAFADK